MSKLLQRLLGVGGLRRRLETLERERPSLELIIIGSQTAMDSIREAAQTGQLTSHLREYLKDLGLKLDKAAELEL